MILLNYWAPQDKPSLARIYVNGLPGAAGKIFMTLTRGGIRVTTNEDERDDIVEVLEEELQKIGISISFDDARQAKRLWKQIVDACTKPRQTAATSPPASQERGGAKSATSVKHDLDITTIKVVNPLRIQVDHREPKELVDLLRQAHNTTVEVVSLPLGDIVIDDVIVIERKRCPEDFEASVVNDDKRLFFQTERIKHRADLIGVVMLEGDLFGARQRMTIQNICGAVSYLGAIQCVSIFQTLDMVHTAYQSIKFGVHAATGLGYELALRANNKPKALLSARRFVLEGIPMVSAGTAQRLLGHFGSIAGVVGASVEQLMQVEGVGQKRAQTIYECLHR